MINAIIVDDEVNSRQSLRNLIERYCPDLNIIGEADSIESGIRIIEESGPKLLFLDIRLREGTSFDILREISMHDYFVIFTTAYDEYAIKAFRFNAIDYLLKPIDLEELIEAVEKVKRFFSQQDHVDNPLIEKLLSFNMHDPTITIATESSIEFLRVFDIIRLESTGTYTTFFMKDGRKIISSRHLKIYDEILSEYNFFRTHQSHLVNMNYVTRLLKSDGGSLELSNGMIVPMSRRRKEVFLRTRKA